MKSVEFGSPTIVLITDRTDLDDQLSFLFEKYMTEADIKKLPNSGYYAWGTLMPVQKLKLCIVSKHFHHLVDSMAVGGILESSDNSVDNIELIGVNVREAVCLGDRVLLFSLTFTSSPAMTA